MNKVPLALALGVVISCTSIAAAQGSGAASAERLFADGRAAMRRKEHSIACAKFADSQRLDPAVGTLLNLAECEEKLGKLGTAWRHLKEVLSTLPASDDRVPDAKRLEAALAPRVPRLTLRPKTPLPPGARVALDGTELPASELGEATPVDPGDHVVVVEAPGRVRKAFTVTVREGETPTVAVEPGEPSAAATRMETAGRRTGRPLGDTSGSTMQTAGLVLGAVGIATIGVGTYFAFEARSKDKEAKSTSCGSEYCIDQAGVELTNEARTAAHVSAACFIAGGVLTTAGLVLVVVSPSAAPATHVAVRGAPDGGLRLSIRGAW
jgi:hypothetical protein